MDNKILYDELSYFQGNPSDFPDYEVLDLPEIISKDFERGIKANTAFESYKFQLMSPFQMFGTIVSSAVEIYQTGLQLTEGSPFYNPTLFDKEILKSLDWELIRNQQIYNRKRLFYSSLRWAPEFPLACTTNDDISDYLEETKQVQKIIMNVAEVVAAYPLYYFKQDVASPTSTTTIDLETVNVQAISLNYGEAPYFPELYDVMGYLSDYTAIVDGIMGKVGPKYDLLIFRGIMKTLLSFFSALQEPHLYSANGAVRIYYALALNISLLFKTLYKLKTMQNETLQLYSVYFPEAGISDIINKLVFLPTIENIHFILNRDIRVSDNVYLVYNKNSNKLVYFRFTREELSIFKAQLDTFADLWEMFMTVPHTIKHLERVYLYKGNFLDKESQSHILPSGAVNNKIEDLLEISTWYTLMNMYPSNFTSNEVTWWLDR